MTKVVEDRHNKVIINEHTGDVKVYPKNKAGNTVEKDAVVFHKKTGNTTDSSGKIINKP